VRASRRKIRILARAGFESAAKSARNRERESELRTERSRDVITNAITLIMCCDQRTKRMSLTASLVQRHVSSERDIIRAELREFQRSPMMFPRSNAAERYECTRGVSAGRNFDSTARYLHETGKSTGYSDKPDIRAYTHTYIFFYACKLRGVVALDTGKADTLSDITKGNGS